VHQHQHPYVLSLKDIILKDIIGIFGNGTKKEY